MFLHSGVGAHAVEELILLAIFLNNLSAALIMAGKKASNHYKVSSSPEGFRYISWIGTAAITHHMSIQSVSCISTFQYLERFFLLGK